MTFSVPNESETGSPTTQLTVALPNVTSAHTELMPGWTVALQHDIAAGTFRSVTWTAAANAGIPADQFALFRIEVTLPNTDTASFPATQTYSDGKAVHWDQPPLPDGSEPEHPAPMLTLTAPTAEPRQGEGRHGSANAGVAVWLAGAALAVSLVSIGLTLTRRSRS